MCLVVSGGGSVTGSCAMTGGLGVGVAGGGTVGVRVLFETIGLVEDIFGWEEAWLVGSGLDASTPDFWVTLLIAADEKKLSGEFGRMRMIMKKAKAKALTPRRLRRSFRICFYFRIFFIHG